MTRHGTAEQSSSRPRTESVPCNLCGARDAVLLYEMPDLLFNPDHIFKVVQCSSCGLGYLNPRPTQDAIDYYYPTAFYASFDQNPAMQARRYAREAAYVEKHAPAVSGRRRRLLDVGCANGDFTRLMKSRGWEVEGVEIGSSARAITDFHVYNSLLPDVPMQGPRYDAITAWAVLEHVHDPMAYFAKASELLNPGGVFVFLVTNVDSLSSQSLYREDIPRHTYFYNRSTVGRYLRSNGLQLIRAVDGGDVYEMRAVGWLLHYINKLRGGRKLAWNEWPPRRQDWLAARGLPNNAANNLRYLFRHPLVVIDRLTVPLFEVWQRLTNTYGITTYIARKPT